MEKNYQIIFYVPKEYCETVKEVSVVAKNKKRREKKEDKGVFTGMFT
jgi:hypothetical protein